MERIGQQDHPDLNSEVGQRLGQAVGVLSTLAEAGARLAAEEMRRRERREEQAEARRRVDERRERQARRAAEQADSLARHAADQRAQHDRRVMAQTLDPQWMDRADLLDLATGWRTARLREHQFPEARVAAETVEDRLRQRYPRPMDLYDQAVRDGVPRAEAMRTAAAQMARTPVMRAHGGRNDAALGPGVSLDEAGLAAAVSDEQVRLATGVDPQRYTEELARLGPGGQAAAQALREALAARAGTEAAQGRRDAATPDDPRTPGVDEHATVGMPHAGKDLGDADRDTAAAGTRTAAQLAAEWYPEGLHHPTAMPREVATRAPANTTSSQQRPSRAAGRSR